MSRVFAVADIGSNTAHLLVAGFSGGGLSRMVNESVWLSLGEVVSRAGRVPERQFEELRAALSGFLRHVEATRSGPLYLFATEAIRRASNHDELIGRISAELGIVIDLITPEREAELGLRGALMDSGAIEEGTFVEAGGGSVQVGRFIGGQLKESVSLPIGTGALIARAGLSQPCSDGAARAARQMVESALEASGIHPGGQVLAAGGVARGIWRAMHPDRAPWIHEKELKFLAWDARRLEIDQIVERYSVKPRRAGTLLPGALIYRAVLRRLSESRMRVSAFGAREGAILEMAEGSLQPCLT